MTMDRNYNSKFEDRVDYPFWQGLQRGELRIQHCTGCGRWLWPAEWRCGECGSWDFDWPVIPGEGRVYAWERTHHSFVRKFSDLLPYVNVLVELPHAGGARILGLVTGPSGNISIGDRVVAEIQSPSARTGNLPAVFWRVQQNRKDDQR